ncbi:MAG: FtsW/RodA/SpoVE family cell cycle protein [Phycisphaerales bacterium]
MTGARHKSVVERLFGPDSTLFHWGWLCVAAGLGLSAMGIYAIDVGSQVTAPEHLSELSGRAIRQGVFLGIGLVAAAMICVPNFRVVRMLAWPAFFVSMALLVFLLVPWVPSSIVRPRNGVRAWIDLGFTDFQPSEMAKIAFVLVAADYLRFRKNHRTLTGLIPPALLTFVPIGLICLEPDLGVALLFLPAIFAILIAAGARLNHLAVVMLAGALAAPAAYPLLKPYQQQRIISLVTQLKDDKKQPDDNAFQQRTGVMLTGAGEAGGIAEEKARALVRYSALPERHNDMVFAVLTARFGLVGALGMFALYAMWTLGALATAAITKDGWARLVIVGLATMVMAQVVVNTAMVVGILPIVGLTLPFVSYGGTSMLAMWVITGLIVSVAMRKPARMSRPTFEFGD